MSDEPSGKKPVSEEWVPADDAIIGKAFRWSAIIAVIVITVGVTAFLMARRSEPVIPPKPAPKVTPIIRTQVAEPPAIPFQDITIDAGINFVHENGAAGDKLLPETMGAGAAFLDFDNDNDQDLILVNSASWPENIRKDVDTPTLALCKNDGSGHFVDITEHSGMDATFYGTGIAVGDYDSDGNIDVFVSAVGSNHLFRNLGEGKFEDVTRIAAVAGKQDAWSTSSGFFDLDNDGDLDLFVCNYVRWSREIDFNVNYRLVGVGRAYGPPMNFEGTFSYLYRNNGDGTFTDVSEESGVQVRNAATGLPAGKALGLTFVDVNEDGYIDIFIANDTVQNFLFVNKGDGTFSDDSSFLGVAFDRNGSATGAMGIDAGIFRNDNSMGFAIGNFANEMSTLYVSQESRKVFADEAIGEGIGAPTRSMLTFGVLFLDSDLDGRLDLLQANGHLEEEINIVQPSQHYEQAAQLFWNAGPTARGCFVPVPQEKTTDLGTPIVGRGAAYADIDSDGDLDLVMTQAGRRPLLLKNQQQSANHWLRLKLVGRNANRDAIGAWASVRVGDVIQRRQVMPTRSYLSQSELPLTFGLGKSSQIEKLTITWPNGTIQDVPPPSADQFMTITQQ